MIGYLIFAWILLCFAAPIIAAGPAGRGAAQVTAAEWSEGAAGPVLARVGMRGRNRAKDYWRPVQASADAIAAAAGPEGRERDWRDDALCAQADPERWFPDFGENGYTLAAVKAVCRRCPVRAECLEFILAPGNEDICGFGIWAGTTERERRRISRERRQEREAAA